MKTIYIIGDDKLGRASMNALDAGSLVYRNQSVGSRRVLKLLRKKIIRLSDIIEMGVAELLRKSPTVPDFPIVKTNGDVRRILEDERPDRVVCFRAGLVLSREVLNLGPEFLNIHCADLPEFGGLGAIRRALSQGALAQNACLHEMVAEIDAGRVFHKEPFELSQSVSFAENEERAYQAGRKILVGMVKGEINPSLDD